MANFPLKKIVSGAQTGADQGGLSAAIRLGLDCGGYIPHGRRTYIGPLPIEMFELWKLTEHSSAGYPPRTEANVKLGDGTVLFGYTDSPGCRLTIKLCKKYNRPYLINPETPEEFNQWILDHNIATLNVAGNREETNIGIKDRVERFLIYAFQGHK